MSLRRVVASALVAVFALATSPALIRAQADVVQVISGTAIDQAKKPYTDYLVELRDPVTGQIVATTTLDSQALFKFTDVSYNKHYIVELWHVVKNENPRIVCAEGPFELSTQHPNRTDVHINCGRVPVAFWLLPAAGAAIVIGVSTRSTK